MPTYLDLDIELLAADKGIWTAQEICQQPESWISAHNAVERQRDRITHWLKPRLADPRLRIVLAGAGSSSFIGQTLAPWLTRTLGRRIDAVSTTDLVGNPSLYLTTDQPTLLVSFARSGDSPESAASVSLADQLLAKCHHLVLTCNRAGQLARLVKRNQNALCIWMPEETNDQSLAMTSGYTSMLVSCASVFAPEPVSLRFAAKAARFVLDNLVARARSLAETPFDRLVVLGAGCLATTAREACLKGVELTNGYLTGTWDTPLGFRHGPKSVVNEKTCVVLLRSANQYTARYDLDLLLELCADRQASSIVVLSPDDFGTNPYGISPFWFALRTASPSTDARLKALATDDHAEIIVVNPSVKDGPTELDDFWISLPYLVFCQILAFFKARTLGIPADNPCPSGKINRVVQGVTIHPFQA